MSTPTIGRIVHYKVTADDATVINNIREARRKWVFNGRAADLDNQPGYQGHMGNRIQAGDVFPAMIVRVFDPQDDVANLQVFLDGNDTLWATSVHEGDGERQYSWPKVSGGSAGVSAVKSPSEHIHTVQLSESDRKLIQLIQQTALGETIS